MGRVMLEIQSRCDLILSFSKHLLMMGVRATGARAPVIQARSFGSLLHWHNGGCFETLGDNRQGKGKVKRRLRTRPGMPSGPADLQISA